MFIYNKLACIMLRIMADMRLNWWVGLYVIATILKVKLAMKSLVKTYIQSQIPKNIGMGFKVDI